MVVGKNPRSLLLSVWSAFLSVLGGNGERIFAHGQIVDGLFQVEVTHLIRTADPLLKEELAIQQFERFVVLCLKVLVRPVLESLLKAGVLDKLGADD